MIRTGGSLRAAVKNLKTGDRRAPMPEPRPQLAENAAGATMDEDDSED